MEMAPVVLSTDDFGQSTNPNVVGPPVSQNSGVSASVSSTVSESSSTVQGSSIQSHISSAPARPGPTGMSGRGHAVFGPNNYGPVGQQRQTNYGPSGAGPPTQGQFGYCPTNYGPPGYGPTNPGQMTSGPMGQGPAPYGPIPHGTMPSGTMGQGQMNHGPMVQGATAQMGYGPTGPMGPGQMGPGLMGSGTPMGPGPMGPGPMGPGPMGQGTMGPGPMGQGTMGPGPMGQGTMGPGPMGSGPMMPGPMVTGPMGPGSMVQGPMGPGPMGPGPGPMGPTPMGPGPIGSGQMGPGQMGPAPMGPGPMGPGPMGPGPMGPGPMGPGPMGHVPRGPGPMGPGPMGPGPMGAGPMGPGPMSTGPMGPGPNGPRPMGPNGPRPMGPGPNGPRPMGPGPMRLPGPGPRGPSVGPRPPRTPTHSNNITVPIRSSGPVPSRNSGSAPRMPGHFSSQPANLPNKSNKRSLDDGESKSGFEADLNLKGQHIPQQKCVKTFSIATRGIGFVTAVAYSRLYESNKTDLNDISVLSLYRAALAFLELKVYQAQKKRPKTKSDFSSAMENLWKEITLLPELERLVRIYSRTLPPIAAVINAIGNFSKDNSWYNVGLINDHLNVAHPLTVNLSNLHQTVSRLSNKTTPVKERKHFYQHNPIPGSVWTDESFDDHPLLLNPNEVMPEDYLEEKTFSKLQQDLVNSVRAAELAAAKNSLMWEDTLVHLEGSGMGSAAVCASCTLKPLRIPSVSKDDTGNVGYPQVTDRMMSMYTDIDLSPSERCLGILSLAGELDILHINDNIPQWAETRSPRGARFVMDCDWMFCASVTGIYS